MARSEFREPLLNGIGVTKACQLADIFSETLTQIEAIVPSGRERSLVVTKLQEAAFFAQRGMALDPVNQ